VAAAALLAFFTTALLELFFLTADFLVAGPVPTAAALFAAHRRFDASEDGSSPRAELSLRLCFCSDWLGLRLGAGTSGEYYYAA
jgi:hypothetical protein